MTAPFRILPLLGATVTTLFLVGCTTTHSFSDVEIARSALLGLTEQDMRMCAGFPNRTVEDGSTSIWSYETTERGSGISLSAPILLGAATTNVNLNSSGTCRAQFRFNGGRVDRLSYAGDNDSARGRDTLCTPIIDDCLTYAQRFGKGSLPPPPLPTDPGTTASVK